MLEDGKQTYRINDTTIAQIAKCLQIAILTGTDICDNLRMIEIESKDDGTMGVTDQYLQNFENNIEKMMEELSDIPSDSEKGLFL